MALSAQFQHAVSPEAPMGGLTAAERQRAEILKAHDRDVRILIPDKPMVLLTPQNADEFFAT